MDGQDDGLLDGMLDGILDGKDDGDLDGALIKFVSSDIYYFIVLTQRWVLCWTNALKIKFLSIIVL